MIGKDEEEEEEAWGIITMFNPYSREGVASVRDEHACLANSSIPNSDTLDEPSCAHFLGLATWSPCFLHPLIPFIQEGKGYNQGVCIFYLPFTNIQKDSKE
jgi:hypothetical protein